MSSYGRRRRVTRDDVAREAGVSPSVVSYVVNDGPRNVAPDTRLRVLAAIDDLGYRPNVNARALRLSSTKTVGVVLPTVENPFFAELAGELERAAYDRGLTILIGNSNGDPSREEKYIRNFVGRQVDGLILVAVGPTPTLAAVEATQTPLVLLDRPLETEFPVPFIGVDNRVAARVITEHLIEHGHERIACIAGPLDQEVSRAREQGWRDAMDAAGLGNTMDLLERGEFSSDSGFIAAAKLLDRAHATAIFVSSDSQTQGVVAAAREAEVAIPDDLAIVSFDGTFQSRFSEPQMTVITQPLREIAVEALETLGAGWRAGASDTYLPFRLTIRTSCGCAPVEAVDTLEASTAG